MGEQRLNGNFEDLKRQQIDQVGKQITAIDARLDKLKANRYPGALSFREISQLQAKKAELTRELRQMQGIEVAQPAERPPTPATHTPDYQHVRKALRPPDAGQFSSFLDGYDARSVDIPKPPKPKVIINIPGYQPPAQ